jgi:hypothetical protein
MRQNTLTPYPPTLKQVILVVKRLRYISAWIYSFDCKEIFIKHLITIVLLCISCSALAIAPALPLMSGKYTFHHRFSEQPQVKSITLIANIKGRHIELINQTNSAVFPLGTIAEGTLIWHKASKQWIIGDNTADAKAEWVGGCSDGPEVIDLINKTYWTC